MIKIKNKMFRNNLTKYYIILGIILIIGFSFGIWSLSLELGLFKVLKVEAALDDPYGSPACFYNDDCVGDDWCGFPLPRPCDVNLDCSSCGSSGPGYATCDGGMCVFHNGGFSTACGYCIFVNEAPPPPGGDCFIPYNEDTDSKFSIEDSSGNEMAFFTDTGYLAFRGALHENLGSGENGIDYYRDDLNWLCGNDNYDEYLIYDTFNNGIAVAFVHCVDNNINKLFTRETIIIGEDNVEDLLNDGPSFNIEGIYVSGVDYYGQLVLPFCYATDFVFEE